MTLEELALQGRHNLYNSMAAGIVGRLVDIRKETIRQSLSDFQNVEHRLEYVARVHGVDFINDSKATNINSTWYALESIDKPVIWIAGGVDKGNDYSMLTDLVRKKVKALICLGVDNSALLEAFRDKVGTIYSALSMEQAVLVAYSLGKQGDVVLLSPACASFDLFEGYEDRGNTFKAAVKSL
jgi:UDP-N-acetylmuramoylalanine--D-glutamate ligase